MYLNYNSIEIDIFPLSYDIFIFIELYIIFVLANHITDKSIRWIKFPWIRCTERVTFFFYQWNTLTAGSFIFVMLSRLIWNANNSMQLFFLLYIRENLKMYKFLYFLSIHLRVYKKTCFEFLKAKNDHRSGRYLKLHLKTPIDSTKIFPRPGI